jgi:hypothetical protein
MRLSVLWPVEISVNKYDSEFARTSKINVAGLKKNLFVFFMASLNLQLTNGDYK